MLVVPFRLHPMVATLATYMALQAVSLLLRPVPGGLIADSVVESIGAQIGFMPIVVIVAIAIAVVLEIALFKSRAGLTLRGVGSRAEAARMSGARPQLTALAAYMGCSFLAGVAAVPMMAQVGSGDPNAGINYTLGGDRRCKPVWRTRLLRRVAAGCASHHSGECRDLVPRYRGLVAVVPPGRDDPHVSRALFQE
jgi:predicted ABC-type sugar transport system permease subunit